MKPWIETDRFVIDVDEDITSRRKGNEQIDEVASNVSALGAELSKLIAQLNAAQWEIKAVVPVLKGVGRRETSIIEPAPMVKGPVPTPAPAAVGGSALGFAWGVSVVDQIVVIVQRTLWVDDAVYEERLGGVLKAEARERIARERAEIEKANVRLQATIDKLMAEAKGVETAEIVFKEGGFLSKRGFRYGGTTYETAAEAEAARGSDLQALKARISELQRGLRPLPDLP